MTFEGLLAHLFDLYDLFAVNLWAFLAHAAATAAARRRM
jgi:hypothetical protein